MYHLGEITGCHLSIAKIRSACSMRFSCVQRHKVDSRISTVLSTYMAKLFRIPTQSVKIP